MQALFFKRLSRPRLQRTFTLHGTYKLRGRCVEAIQPITALDSLKKGFCACLMLEAFRLAQPLAKKQMKLSLMLEYGVARTGQVFKEVL